ncbi:MAG: ParA family protein [Rickettsiales bacterium]
MFCNNKGGVGKTTLAFNCAAAFADKGYKTVLMDLDPQCNSTILSLGRDFYDDLFAEQNIYSVIRGVFEGGSDIDLRINFLPAPNNQNLFIMPGSLRLSAIEDTLGGAFTQAMSGNKIGYFITSAIYRFMIEKGMQEQIDIFVIDSSPSLGALNRAIVLGTDFFVVPMMPDSFSVQGIENLGGVLEKWKTDWRNTAKAVQGDTPAKSVLPGDPTFIGYIINSYNIYGQQPIKAHRKWIDEIPGKVKENLSLKHSRNGLVEQSWKEYLAQIQDYGQLTSLGQSKLKAIFNIELSELTDNAQGTKENLERSKKEFGELANKILSIIGNY